MFPTVAASKFAQSDWKDHFAETGYNTFETRGYTTVGEILARLDQSGIYSPDERLKPVPVVAPDTFPGTVDPKPAAPVQTRVEPARVARLEPEPAPVDPKPAASVFTALTQQAVRMAECPFAKRAEEMARNKGRLSGKTNSEGVARTWGDGGVRAARLVREGVQVTLPSGEVRLYTCVREAFEFLRLDVKKHIKFRVKLKAKRELAFEADSGASYAFKIVPRA
jgi:hypothetical protein